MAIPAIVAMVVLGFNLGLTLMPFLLSWSLTLNASTFFLLVANLFLFSPLNPLQFFASWGTALLGTIQACVFLRSTINPSRMLTFWHYDSKPLRGHLEHQYFEIAIRGVVCMVYILEGSLFIIEDIRTVTFLGIRAGGNLVLLAAIFIYFQIVLRRPTIAHFYLAMILTSSLADIAIVIVATTFGEDKTGGMILAFFGVHMIAAVATLLVTAIYGSAYNRFRVDDHECGSSERLYPIFHDHQLYAPSLWLYMPEWFRSSPHPIAYTEEEVAAPQAKSPVAFSTYQEAGGEEDDSYNSLYDASVIDSELEEMMPERPTNPPVQDVSHAPPSSNTKTPPPKRVPVRSHPFRSRPIRIVPRRQQIGYRK